MKKQILLLLALVLLPLAVQAQRFTDRLDRGLVVTIAMSGTGNFISWRILPEEYYDVTYCLYADGQEIAKDLKVSNYVHAEGNEATKYQVKPVIRGKDGELSAYQTRWQGISHLTNGISDDPHTGYLDILCEPALDRNNNDVTSAYEFNDVVPADVNGDGVVDLVCKRNYTGDIYNSSTCFHRIEIITLESKRLWWIDLGPNMMAGPDEQWDAVAYDWDMDGKAEVLLRGADNMIIHTSTGRTINIGNMSYVAPRNQYTCEGAEYLLYLNGETGEPYGWDGTSDKYTPMAYPLPRYDAGETDYIATWGPSTNGGHDNGHKSSKHYFGAPYLDGQKPSIFLGRGCYTRHKFTALNVNPTTHELTQLWYWSNNQGWNSPWYGNGYHNYAIADVDLDGRDEIVFGSMVIDDNGKGLSTTGLGHGDAQHCGDLDPYRWGLEQFACNEDEPAMNYRNATTSEFYYRLKSTGDDGRAMAGNFSNNYPGSLGQTAQTGVLSLTADKVIPNAPGLGPNARIYWDGDLLEEFFDSPGTAKAAKIEKLEGGRIFNSEGNLNNSSKNNACLTGDILGDWREEVLVRLDTGMRLYTTSRPTEFRIPSLWYDHQYRNAMLWETIGYNQPPHLSYFLGELEGITIAPPALSNTGRELIDNGGTISSAQNDKQVLVCGNQDNEITVASGATPWNVIFNVPSWTQGQNASETSTTIAPVTTFCTTTVKGAPFTGTMRLIKQGEGVLNLPAVEQTYTGNTDIWAGTLNFDGKLLGSSLWLNRFTTLNSDGGQFRSIKMEYASILRPGGADKRSTVTTDSLTLGFGSRLIMDLYSENTASDLLKVKTLNIETKNWKYGPAYLAPVLEVKAHPLEGNTSLSTGKYLIAEGLEKIIGQLENIIIEGVGTNVRSRLVQEEDKIYLVINSVREPGTIVWNGNENDRWDFGISENFTLGNDATVTNEVFNTGDKVLFDGTASRTTITLRGELEADSVIVDNVKGLTFTGSSGKLIGNTTLVKRGSGTLTISNDNTYTGGTRLSGGTIIATGLSNANQTYGNLGGVNTVANKFIIENGAELRTTALVIQGSPMSMQSEEGGVINNSQDFFINKPVSGTVLTKKGNGWMKLNAQNSMLQRFVLAAGTLQMIGQNTPAQTVEFRNGTLVESQGSSYAIYVPKGGNGVQDMTIRSTYSNPLTGEGTIRMICRAEQGGTGSNLWWATRSPIQGNWSEFQGTVIAEGASGGKADPNPRFTLNTGTGLPKGTLQIADGTTVLNTGKTFAIGRVSGDKGKLGGWASFRNNESTTGANTWKIGNDANWIWSGTVTANSILIKTGRGKVTLNGASDHTGSTTIEAGELHFGSSAKLGTGALSVKSGATLSGANTVALTNSQFTFDGGSTLQVGATATSTVGYIHFGGKNVLLATGAILELGVKGAATATNTGCTYLSEIGRLTLNATIRLHYASNLQLAAGDSIVLWKNVGSVIGTPVLETKRINGWLSWDTTDLKRGILRVIQDAPEAISGVEADTEVNVQVTNTAGASLKEFTTHYGNVNQTFAYTNLPRGIYLLRITALDKTNHEGLEVRKCRK